MWRLVAVAGIGETHRFLIGVDYVVGRKNCAILIQDDQSISRAHATFTVCHLQSNLSRQTALPELTIKDTSKYGTFVNEEKLQNNVPKILKSGDQVTCGVFHSKFRVEYEPLITCSSCLEGPGKSSLNHALLQLGGHVVNNWTEECTHLVMNSVKVTIKTICALICMRPIVKPEYFDALIKAIQTKQPLPKPESFYPPVDEPSINSEKFDLSGRQERRTIFSGKTFLFLNAKQHKKLSPAVSLGGGEAKLLHQGSKEMPLLDSPGTCVIDAGYAISQLLISESTKEWCDSITAVLHRKGLRAIPEAEIGLAVIFMSTETYCNAASHPTEGSSSVSKATISGPTLSESMAVDETIMPAPTFNTTAYVANTEPQDQDTWMEVSGVQEVKETPRVDRRKKVNVQDMPTVKESPGAAGLEKTTASSLTKESKTATEQRSQHLLPPTAPKLGKNKDKASQQQSDLMKSYFKVASKKRERDDDVEQEVSAPKAAKTAEKSLNFSEEDLLITTPSMSKILPAQNQSKGFVTNSKSSSWPAEMSVKSGQGNGQQYDDESAAEVSTSKTAPQKKRKEPEDLAIGSEEFGKRLIPELNTDMGDQSQNSGMDSRKKRRLDSVDTKIKEEDITIVADECESQSMQNIKRESEMKVELSESLRKPTKNIEKLEDSDTLPSKLLRTEFKSLIVSNPTRKSYLKEKTGNGMLINYKKFKKVSYPGADGFPNIIGGSDLIAHNAKKNSELELWLREEMEEQTQHAREESLADDLFRYNPKSNKKRR
ncbi:nibrin [Lissotriton helveticus]